MNRAIADRPSDVVFGFGKNWSRFLRVLDARRISEAEESLKRMLELEDLTGQRFLDIGSGSGLFSLAARRLGASVYSFDYDPDSVACTAELRRRYFPDDSHWAVEHGSVLDTDYIRSLGEFNIVYAWGVLHHTGAMWKALDNVLIPLTAGGRLFISIYNDQRHWSVAWRRMKMLYNQLPFALRIPYATAIIAFIEAKTALACLLTLQPRTYSRAWTRYYTSRGMSRWHDLIDWVGGYPFEVAKPEQIFDFYQARRLVLRRLKTCWGGRGCNEYVFERPAQR